MEENTVLSDQGRADWPMNHYASCLSQPGFIDDAVEDAKVDYEDMGDMEAKLRLGGLELLRDALNGK